jgi:hypothetical protein
MSKIYIDNYEFVFDTKLTKIEIDEWGDGSCKIIMDKKYHENLNESIKDNNQIYIVSGDKIWKTVNPEVNPVWRLDDFIGIDIKGELIKVDSLNF